MEQIVTKKGLIGGLKNVLSVEVLSRESYEKELATFKNPEIKEALKSIKENKEKHINLLKNLIEFLDKTKQ